jgi:hypothetical protein
MADRPSRSPKRRILLEAGTGAAVLATVLLVVLLHLSMVSMPHRLPPASPTSPPTLAPTNLLSWKTVDVPPSLVNVRNLIDLAVAPSNADTAYICNNQANSLQIWVTHDRGLSWQATSPLPTSQSGDCYLVVDSAQPDVVVAADEYRPAGDVSPMDAYALDFFSADGGASWQTIRSNVGFGELATYHGMTYALAVDLRASRRTAHLVASSNLLSWSDVDTTITSSGDAVDSFWLNPTNGELAAEGTYLWDSRDGGRHWSQLPLSPVYGLHAQLVEQLPAAGQPWHLCDTQQINADLAAGPEYHPAHDDVSKGRWQARSQSADLYTVSHWS